MKVATGIERAAFGVAVAASALVFWIAPYPPMVDLAQHAGQIALLKDMLSGTSPWAALFQINYFTPYWGGYGTGVLLSHLLPIAAVVKTMLSLAVIGFVGFGMLARRRFGADPRLDWLLLPGLFGFATHFGLLTFFFTAPLVFLWILLLQWRSPVSVLRALLIVFFGIAMFFMHGLLFVFCLALGGLTTLTAVRSLRGLVVGLAPFAVLGALALAFGLRPRELDAPLQTLMPFEWDITSRRFTEFVSFIWSAATGWPQVVVTLLLCAVPWVMGLRPSWRPAAFAPLCVLLLLWFFTPQQAMNTAYLFQRFALFSLPFYAFIFARSAPARGAWWQNAALVALILAALTQIALEARRHYLFAQETVDFAPVADAIPPAERVIAFVFDPQVPSSGDDPVLAHFALWYQAERGGLVDFNFASFVPQIVRYRHDAPRARPDFDVDVDDFDWHKDHPEVYAYFIMRGPSDRIDHILDGATCRLVKVAESGTWTLLHNEGCAP